MTLLMANWKMQGEGGLAHHLLGALKDLTVEGCEVAVMVPFPYLARAQSILEGSSIAWGAQAVHAQSVGAFTGCVSASMLAEFGCRYVLVGHSERRIECGEDAAAVAQQALQVIRSGMVPVICVGESLAARTAGESDQVVSAQVQSILTVFESAGLTAISCIWAYEPVWAIGAGQAATPQQAAQMHAHIRSLLSHSVLEFSSKCRMIYGGSVNEDNLASFLAESEIEGVLVGGASLNSEQFSNMVAVCMG